jgi:hypothetical protein
MDHDVNVGAANLALHWHTYHEVTDSQYCVHARLSFFLNALRLVAFLRLWAQEHLQRAHVLLLVNKDDTLTHGIGTEATTSTDLLEVSRDTEWKCRMDNECHLHLRVVNTHREGRGRAYDVNFAIEPVFQNLPLVALVHL